MDVMGIINLYESEELLHEITQHRPLAAVPFGGRYRLIDFVLSNMVNSGITNVGILFQHKYRSLMDHLRSGKEWDLARKRDGLALLTPAHAAYPQQPLYGGDVSNFYSNLDYIRYSRQKYVIISGSGVVCNIDYKPVLQFHENTGADVTVLYTEKDFTGDHTGAVIINTNSCDRVTDMEVSSGSAKLSHMSLGMYMMERRLLVDLIEECMAHGGYDFVKHCLIKNIDKLKIFGCRHNGYTGRIYSLFSYFRCSMELLHPAVWQELFFNAGLIYTKVKDEPPSKYMNSARVNNSLVAGGCVIEGTIENSILFRGVTVGKGAHIKNSIVVQKSVIDGGALLDQVICDKNVHITKGRQLKGDCSYPLVIKKGMVV